MKAALVVEIFSIPEPSLFAILLHYSGAMGSAVRFRTFTSCAPSFKRNVQVEPRSKCFYLCSHVLLQ